MTFAWVAYSEDWELRDKVTFDGPNKLVLINEPEIEIDVEEDIYSAWKRWVVLRDNSKYLDAVRAVGGDPTIAGQRLGSTFFMINGWKIRTWEGDHDLQLVGNLFVDGGGNPFIPTIDPHNIVISRTTTNLVDKVEVPGGDFTPTQVGQIVAAVVPAVWDLVMTSHVSPGTAGGILAAAAASAAAAAASVADVTLLRKALTNRMEESPGNPGQLILFDDDGISILARWELRDATGSGVVSAPGAPARRSARSV